jgi:branched-chain amino acid aminotransferase
VQIAAIASIDHRPVGAGKIGPITKQLRDMYFDIVRGKVPKYKHWCTPVYETGGGTMATEDYAKVTMGASALTR